MDIRGMHYDINFKLNKVDSQQYKNLKVPEKDWALNEAKDIFIKSIAEPRIPNHLGFEMNQRTIDDIRTIVVNGKELIPTINDTEYQVALPSDYMFYLSAEAIISRKGCKDKKIRLTPIQHDDLAEEDSFYQSSFEWGDVNMRFFSGGIKVFTDGTFTVKKVLLNYIREHAYMHNAQDFLPTGSYKLPSGVLLTGRQDCELPKHTHGEIVDIAVLILSGNLDMPNYQLKQAKLTLNQLN